MPKAIFTPIQLPPEQPDRCSRCPLLGKRPQSELTKGQRQAYCCLGVFTHEGFPPLTSKGVERSAAAYRKQKRLLHRPCDNRWAAWMTLPGRKLGISNVSYIQCRIPYEQGQQLQIKFHK